MIMRLDPQSTSINEDTQIRSKRGHWRDGQLATGLLRFDYWLLCTSRTKSLGIGRGCVRIPKARFIQSWDVQKMKMADRTVAARAAN